MSHATVKPARLKIHSTELATDVLRTIGYRGRCACGWQGPVRGAHSVAREDARIHTATCREGVR